VEIRRGIPVHGAGEREGDAAGEELDPAAVLLQQLVVAEALQSGRTTVAQGHGEAERRGRCWISAGTVARV